MLANQRSAIFRERLQQFISANVREKLEHQGVQTDIDNELNAQFMASAFVGLTEWWIRNHMPHSPEYMAAQVWKLFERNEIVPR
jgi:hypothetical protein